MVSGLCLLSDLPACIQNKHAPKRTLHQFANHVSVQCIACDVMGVCAHASNVLFCTPHDVALGIVKVCPAEKVEHGMC